MPTSTFNEAEKYLLQIGTWQQACRVQKSLKEIRSKYTEICERVCTAIMEEHRELDLCEAWVTQSAYDGIIDIGRKKWQQSENCKACICIENLRLESLLDDNAEHPLIGIWAGTAKKPAIDVKGIKRVQSSADKILTKDELAICERDDPSDYCYFLWYELPEKRAELVAMLLEGDGQAFVDCLVAHCEVFTKFIPVLDEVVSKTGKK